MQDSRKKHKRKIDRRHLKNVLGVILLFGSALLLLYPDFDDYLTVKEAEEFRQSLSLSENTYSSLDDQDEEDLTSSEEIASLWESIQGYNESLQNITFQRESILASSPATVWDSKQVFGTIEIPSIGVDMPLYINATSSNLAKGAAILEGTSLPIGGIGTNSVISGHRGWKGSSYFKEIEQINVGDSIIITNSWETLYYKVIGMAVISPTDIDLLQVQEDLDLITLITCHPYRAPRNLRYVVCAIRVDSEEDTIEDATEHFDKKLVSSLLSLYTQDKTSLLAEVGSSSMEIKGE